MTKTTPMGTALPRISRNPTLGLSLRPDDRLRQCGGVVRQDQLSPGRRDGGSRRTTNRRGGPSRCGLASDFVATAARELGRRLRRETRAGVRPLLTIFRCATLVARALELESDEKDRTDVGIKKAGRHGDTLDCIARRGQARGAKTTDAACAKYTFGCTYHTCRDKCTGNDCKNNCQKQMTLCQLCQAVRPEQRMMDAKRNAPSLTHSLMSGETCAMRG